MHTVLEAVCFTGSGKRKQSVACAADFVKAEKNISPPLSQDKTAIILQLLQTASDLNLASLQETCLGLLHKLVRTRNSCPSPNPPEQWPKLSYFAISVQCHASADAMPLSAESTLSEMPLASPGDLFLPPDRNETWDVTAPGSVRVAAR